MSLGGGRNGCALRRSKDARRRKPLTLMNQLGAQTTKEAALRRKAQPRPGTKPAVLRRPLRTCLRLRPVMSSSTGPWMLFLAPSLRLMLARWLPKQLLWADSGRAPRPDLLLGIALAVAPRPGALLRRAAQSRRVSGLREGAPSRSRRVSFLRRVAPSRRRNSRPPGGFEVCDGPGASALAYLLNKFSYNTALATRY